MIFDHPPAEFPVATAVPREARGRAIALGADLRRWLLARWEWFRPRSVPCAVAALGMLAVIGAVQYLTHFQVESTWRGQSSVVNVDTVGMAGVVHVDIVGSRVVRSP